MALRTSRMSVLRGRPPGRGAGISGSSMAHWASVMSVGYRWRFMFHYTQLTPFGTDSYLRGTPQVQIWDFTEPSYANLGADKGSGGLWNNSPGNPGKDPLTLADNPIGQWNSFRIIQTGARTTIYLNGKLVVDHAILENYWDRANPIPARGPIQLQTHGSEIRWRNIKVREIP